MIDTDIDSMEKMHDSVPYRTDRKGANFEKKDTPHWEFTDGHARPHRYPSIQETLQT